MAAAHRCLAVARQHGPPALSAALMKLAIQPFATDLRAKTKLKSLTPAAASGQLCCTCSALLSRSPLSIPAQCYTHAQSPRSSSRGVLGLGPAATGRRCDCCR